MTKLGFGIIFH